MPSPARLSAYGIGVAAAELAGGIGLAAAFGWQRVSLVLVASALVTAVAVAALRGLLRPDANGGGEGGVGPLPPDPEPPWWPEFERDLRAHLRERERAPL
jgi:hypothetical protein